MNILHINYSDIIGARFTGYYMQQSLDSSYNVEMAVWEKLSQSSFVHPIPPSNSIIHKLTNFMMKLSSRIGFDRLFGYGGWLLAKTDYFKKADIIHIHLIHNFSNLSILSLPRICRLKPVVWTLHDPWAITGGCEHSFDCNRWLSGCSPRCPYPRAKSIFMHYEPYMHWRIKQAIYRKTDITLIIASQWMEDKIKKSPLVKHLNYRQIAFGIDLNIFIPKQKKDSRSKFDIPFHHKVIAFRDSGFKRDKFKGLRWLMEALEMYEPKSPTTLLILEDGEGFSVLSPKYNIVRTGWIDGENLVHALSAADIFVMPSIQESFGVMAVEAMACGTPVIVFEGTALPSVIQSPKGGLTVPSKDSKSLAYTIEKLLEDEQLRAKMGESARQLAESEYKLDVYVNKHILLYKEVIKRYHNTY
jgi:Glycosyltransferase